MAVNMEGAYMATLRAAGRTSIGLGWTAQEARRHCVEAWSDATGYPAVAIDRRKIQVEQPQKGGHWS